MKKEIRKEEHIVVSNHEVYIADDGKEFDNGYECMKYEQKCKSEEIEPKLEAMKINELDGVAPVDVDDDFPERSFWWFNLKSKQEYDLIVDYFECQNVNVDFMLEPDVYPKIVCVMAGDDYAETRDIDDIIHNIKWFFKLFGYNIEFKKEK